jgi:hypothetical protein
MNFQEVCRELEKWAGKPLEPIILEEHEVFLLGDSLRNAFTPGDTGARKVQLDWDRAKAFVEQVKGQAEPDVRIFYMERFESGVEVAVGQSENKYDILCWAHTDGLSYDLFTEDLIRELKKIEEKYGELEILLASYDSLELGLSRLPEDYSEFIYDLCGFCPDLRAQMFHEEEDLIEYIRENRSVPLWWD